MPIKRRASEHVLDWLNYAFLFIAMLVTLYPFVYTFSMSISNPLAAARHEVVFLPVGFSLESYKLMLQNDEIYLSYYNTLWYTIVGTAINVGLTVLSAYPLSRKRFFARKMLMRMLIVTMFFSGGLIPSYILITKLGLYNTRWAIVIPAAISTWNLIITRTFFESIPDSLEEAARIDGATDFTVMLRVFLPLSLPIVAVMSLFYAVGHWNSYFSALLYLHDKDLQPVQLYLRRVLTLSNTESTSKLITGGTERSVATLQLKYTVIIVTVLPIICVYPFLQRFFVKGVLVGAIKG